jgi:hypothetical protein
MEGRGDEKMKGTATSFSDGENPGVDLDGSVPLKGESTDLRASDWRRAVFRNAFTRPGANGNNTPPRW